MKQEEKAYVMDVAAVNKICNGTFHGSKIFSKVATYLIHNNLTTVAS